MQAGDRQRALECALDIAATDTNEESVEMQFGHILANSKAVGGLAVVVSRLQRISLTRAAALALYCMRGQLPPEEAVRVADLYAAREDVATAIRLLNKYLDRVGDRKGDSVLQTRLLQWVLSQQPPHNITNEEGRWCSYNEADVGRGLERQWPLHAACWYQRFHLDDLLLAACRRQPAACYGLAAYLLQRNDAPLWSRFLQPSLPFHNHLVAEQLCTRLLTAPCARGRALTCVGGSRARAAHR